MRPFGTGASHGSWHENIWHHGTATRPQYTMQGKAVQQCLWQTKWTTLSRTAWHCGGIQQYVQQHVSMQQVFKPLNNSREPTGTLQLPSTRWTSKAGWCDTVTCASATCAANEVRWLVAVAVTDIDTLNFGAWPTSATVASSSLSWPSSQLVVHSAVLPTAISENIYQSSVAGSELEVSLILQVKGLSWGMFCTVDTVTCRRRTLPVSITEVLSTTVETAAADREAPARMSTTSEFSTSS